MSEELNKADKDKKLEEIAKQVGGGKTLKQLREGAKKFESIQQGRYKKDEKPLTDTTKKYFEKIYSQENKAKDYSISALLGDIGGGRKKKIISYPVPLADCETLFWSIIEDELSVMDVPLIIEDVNRQRIMEMIKYFSGYPTKLNVNKGIYLYGAVGRGKTVIMKALLKMCNIIEKRLEAAKVDYTAHRFKLQTAKAIVAELADDKKPGTMNKYYSGEWCFDDLGAEDTYKLWGNEMNVLGDIIVERHKRYQYSGMLTHATSNIKDTDWFNKYGERVESRMNELFNVVLLEGVDKRKIKK